MKLLILILLFTTLACATKPPTARLAEKYQVITGILVAPAELKNGNHRLILYFTEQKEVKEEKDPLLTNSNGEVATDTQGKVILAPKIDKAVERNVLMCVAQNIENKQVLINTREYLNDPKAQNKTVYIYGTLIDNSWNEFNSGIYCYIEAIGFYVPITGNYIYIITGYGDGVFDNFSWSEFIKKIGATAVDKAL